MRNTDPFRDASCRVMRQRVEICSHHRYDEDDEEEHNVDIGGLSVRDYVISTSPRMDRSRSSVIL